MKNTENIRESLLKHWSELQKELVNIPESELEELFSSQNVTTETGLNAIFDGLTVEHQKKLDKYADMLIKWNKAYNLIGKSTEKFVRFRHLLDSLQLIPFVQGVEKILDIGSGAGLPAVPLSIVLNSKIYACEPLQKRCLFLNQVKRELNLNSNFVVWNKKTQEIDKTQWQFDVITARAVADLKDLIAWGLPLLKPNGKFVLLKGATVEDEIANVQNSQMTFLIKSSITNPNGKVVIIQP